MADWVSAVEDKQNKATLKRKRGDAFSKNGQTEEARAAYREGVELLERALDTLQDKTWNRLDDCPADEPLPSDQRVVAEELVETFGARGGLLRRLSDRLGALGSYQLGAEIERK